MRHGLPDARRLMRLALVVSGGLDRSGRERVTPAILWLVERLARRHQVFVYVLRYYDQPCSYPLLGATIRDLGSPAGIRRQYAALVAALRRDGPFGVIHGYLGLPSGLVAALAGKRLGVPSIVTFDSGELVAIPDIDYGLQIKRRQRLAIAVVARLATRLTVCTHYQAQLAARFGLEPAVVPLGVDAGIFAQPSSWIAPSGPAGGAPHLRILHVASLNRVKDQATLLEAFALVNRAHLDIVGEDTLGGSVARLARDLGVADRVTFHGFQPTDVLVTLYRRADLFVLSSRHEAANVSVLEAAASGVASVGTHVGYLADWSPARAVTVAPGDHVALARAINDLLADPARRARLAAAAREWTLAHDADFTAQRFEELYRSAGA
jgi:glycosyltransferase involved in cell wall biosynthesis